jgi:hypothetical protein
VEVLGKVVPTVEKASKQLVKVALKLDNGASATLGNLGALGYPQVLILERTVKFQLALQVPMRHIHLLATPGRSALVNPIATAACSGPNVACSDGNHARRSE